MSFTTLKVIESGVLLYVQHEERFRNAGENAVNAYRKFAADAAPGIYNLFFKDKSLHVSQRGESRLFDNMPMRYVTSPIAHLENRIVKPSHPSVYTNLIEPGITTFMTSADGKEIFETCSASVIAWNGKNIVIVPGNRPAVKSTMEEFLKTLPNIIEEPILADSNYPIALINAIVCTCTVYIKGRSSFPAEQLKKIKEYYLTTARRS